jgi:CRISPR/Cas system-associated exonuclease Cas4 (RecB family)
MIYISASSIADFIKCPQKVLYRLTKPFPIVRNKEMIMGEIVHKAIELGWRDRAVALGIVRKESQEQKLLKADKVNMEFALDMFFFNFAPRLTEQDKIEYMFKLPYQDDVFLVGKMDRISNENVFDWKTGRVAYKLGTDPQCIIYDFAYNKIFGKKARSVNIGALSTGELIPYVSNELAKKELFDNIIPRMIRTIRNQSYERLGIYNHSCFRCIYKDGCLTGGNNELVDSNFIT